MNRERIAPALGKISSGLYIATGVLAGAPVGMLCSFVEQAAFEPPMVSLAIAPGRPISPVLDSGAPFALHVLSKENNALMKSFARGGTPESFSGHLLVENEYKLPIFQEAWAYLVARVISQMPAGDHTLYLAEIIDGGLQHEGQQASTRVRGNGFGY
jgi:3-hydroxy-9,10-secoandrosta-1,3,5(10)-triene-9,17-dione monooxygenase reductase component